MRELPRGLAFPIVAVGSDPVCAMYRFELPLRAMVARAWCSALVFTPHAPFDVVAGSPVLTQRHIAFDPSTIARLKASDCTFIHDIDDLLWDLPLDNPHRAAHTPQLLTAIDTSLRLADVVTTTTEPLAHALEERGIPAVIVPNLLDPADWTLEPQRAERSRLRVGWYGQRNVHAGDLDLVRAVVEALADQIDFVFYGDAPQGLDARRGQLEVYPATSLELFPTMLARLDVDLILAPLVDNAFNRAKSNLRLLQAGMLGYAAIASDVEPHRTLPVTLVDHRARSWIAALRDRIGEIPAVRAEGRALRAAVRERYLLDDRRVTQIFSTWTNRTPLAA